MLTLRAQAALLTWVFAVGLIAVLASLPAKAQLVACSREALPQVIADALSAIERSTDPCGESTEVTAVLETLRGCTTRTYQICTDTTARRNVFDRGASAGLPQTITWNPELRSELDTACEGGACRSLVRDPVASLVHELAHAAQDCHGLNPGEHELEAVRIENIYRRAVGLGQRTVYGEERLPPAMAKVCDAQTCPCSQPRDAAEGPGHTRLASRADVDAPSGDGQVPQPANH